MKVFRCLVLLAIACGSTALASATPLDFHMNVLDPPPTTFPTFVILTTPFSVSFTPCAVGELPGGITAQGCFSGVNRTGQDWTGLEITFANNAVLAGQTPNCAPASSNNVYSSTNCTLSSDLSTYLLEFSSGVIHNNDFFFITEEGVVPADFGTGSVAVEVLAPEPAPIVLLFTGFILFGCLITAERGRAIRSSLLP